MLSMVTMNGNAHSYSCTNPIRIMALEHCLALVVTVAPLFSNKGFAHSNATTTLSSTTTTVLQGTLSTSEVHKNDTAPTLNTDYPEDLVTSDSMKAPWSDTTALDHTSSISSTSDAASQASSSITESLEERTTATAALGNGASSNTTFAPESSSLLTTEGSKDLTSETTSATESPHASSSGAEGLEDRTTATEVLSRGTLSRTSSTPEFSFRASLTTTGIMVLSNTTTTSAVQTTSDPSSTLNTHSRTSTKVLAETSTAKVDPHQILTGLSNTILGATDSTYSTVHEASTSSDYTPSQNESSTTSHSTLSMPTESYSSTPEPESNFTNFTETATEVHTESVPSTISKSSTSTAEITTEETTFSNPPYLESTTIHLPPTPSDEFPIAIIGIIFVVVAMLLIVTAFIWKTKKAKGGKGGRKIAKKYERNPPPTKSPGSKASTSKEKKERRKGTGGKPSPETTPAVTKQEKTPTQEKATEHREQLKNEQQHKGKAAASKPSQGVGQEKEKAPALKQLAAPDIFPFTVAELERQQVNEFNKYIDKLTDRKTRSDSMMSTVI